MNSEKWLKYNNFEEKANIGKIKHVFVEEKGQFVSRSAIEWLSLGRTARKPHGRNMRRTEDGGRLVLILNSNGDAAVFFQRMFDLSKIIKSFLIHCLFLIQMLLRCNRKIFVQLFDCELLKLVTREIGVACVESNECCYSF